jgi:hypothetical protein
MVNSILKCLELLILKVSELGPREEAPEQTDAAGAEADLFMVFVELAAIIVNRIKATLARLGIRNFKPTLRKAAERLATVHTPEGMPLPPNALAELQRDMARLRFVVSQIREIEEASQKRLEQQPGCDLSLGRQGDPHLA